MYMCMYMWARSRRYQAHPEFPIWKGEVAVLDAVLGVLGVHVSQTLHHPGDIVIFWAGSGLLWWSVSELVVVSH